MGKREPGQWPEGRAGQGYRLGQKGASFRFVGMKQREREKEPMEYPGAWGWA